MGKLVRDHIVIAFWISLFPIVGYAQGIAFGKYKSWEDVLQLSKSTGKIIFVDCYATWCRPCKWMDENVLSKTEAGNYFNEHFINVKVQIDQIEKGDILTKTWYADAAKLVKKYQVTGVPAYLFIAPDGVLVGKSIGASESTDAFLQKTKKLMDKDEQYFFLLEAYNNGNQDPAFLEHLRKSAAANNDTEMLKQLSE